MQPKQLIQTISRWENVLIETIAISVIIISAAVTANYFGWPSTDPTVKVAAAVYAYGVDGMFYICVRLARHYLSYGLSIRGVCLGLFWMALSAIMGAFTWHNNLLFAATSWHISAEALQRVGFTDAQELQLHAIIPVAVVLIVAVIPRRHAKDERTPEQIMADGAREIALAEVKNKVRAAKAKVAGAGLRGTVSGFAGQVLNIEEKKQEEVKRTTARKARKNEQSQMLALADFALRSECEDEEGDIDYALLEARLREAGLWPRSVAKLNADAEVPSEASVSDPDMDAVTAQGTKKWLVAEEVAQDLGISLYQAKQRMDPKYRGRFPRIKTHKFTVNGKPVRKAYYKDVDDIKQRGFTESGMHLTIPLNAETSAEAEEEATA